LLGISPSYLYYPAVPESETNLFAMRLIDEEWLRHPYLGKRRFTNYLRQLNEKPVFSTLSQGQKEMWECDLQTIGVRRVAHLMYIMDIKPIYPGPNFSKNTVSYSKQYPYLLKNLDITHANQVWGTDITYIPVDRGYLYLVAVLDLFSRYIVSWELSNTMEVGFCLEAVRTAIELHGKPEILNSDQGSQFTSGAYFDLLTSNGIKISLDGKGRCYDNIFVERLWRTLKYEEVYLKSYNSAPDAYINLKEYINYYNSERSHQSLNYQTPEKVYLKKCNT
jgi:putative transposase